MKKTTNPFLLLVPALILSALLLPRAVGAESVRQPVWAGRFYPADPFGLARDIDQLARKARDTRIQIPKNKRLRAIIMPHAGHIYSGWTAAHVARVLPAGQFSKVILMGPDHRIGLKNVAICDVAAYQTPLGRINLHKDAAKLRQQPDLFQTLAVDRDREHSAVIRPVIVHG